MTEDSDETRPGQESRARGLVLGLALGEALAGADVPPAPAPLPCGVGTQLACFTVQSLVQASIRQAHRGIAHAPSMAWHAYRQWAALQGLIHETPRGGWLTRVGVLGERRGSAPATVTALQSDRMGTPDAPVNDSAGGHALVRTLPVGLLTPFTPLARNRRGLHRIAAEYGALTHGHPGGYGAAADGAVLVAALLDEARETPGGPPLRPGGPPRPQPDPTRAGMHALDVLAEANVPDARRRLLTAAVHAADADDADRDTLRRVAPDRTGPSCLAGAVYAVCAAPGHDDVEHALRLASAAPDPQVTAATTGALLGSLHGADALPVSLVSRLELAWVADTMARDLVRECTESPSGSEWFPATDPYWWDRYTGA